MTVEFVPSNLAALVRAFRDREGLSLGQLARRANVSKATISRIENQITKGGPDVISLIQVMNACGIDPATIFISNDEDGQTQIRNIGARLRASRTVSQETLQALEAIMRAAQPTSVADQG